MTKGENREKRQVLAASKVIRPAYELVGKKLLQRKNLPQAQYYRFYLLNLVGDCIGLLKSMLIREFELGLAFNLFPVFLAVGIAIYFSVPAEPILSALVLAVAAFVGTTLQIKSRGWLYFLMAVLSSVFCGMLVAKVSTHHSFTPQIERQMTTVVTGLIINVDHNRRGAPRLLLKPVKIEGLKPSEFPKHVRISTGNKSANYEVGDWVRGLARIQPVSGPAFPGSYNFSFHSWFQGLGGSGFFMGAPEVVNNHAAATGNAENISIAINSVRDAIKRRIETTIPGMGSDIAVALITGDKSRIPEAVQDSLRKTGLAHILAISGLHMALVTLTLIWFIRLVFAVLPQVNLRYPVKKWAATVGFFGATIYLLLSGAGIATQRAWIMISVMLLAVLLDRRAITMRSVAVAATIILVISPQSLFTPGFQMSFAAVAALVAGYEYLNKRKRDKPETAFTPVRQNIAFRVAEGFLGYVAGLSTTSLIAGSATAFVAAWHFHQIAPLGLLANVLAMPIVGFVIMPFALFSMILMPFGLEAIALWPVEQGISLVVAISLWVESLSPSAVTGVMPSGSLLLFACSMVLLTLLKTRLRLFSFLPVVLAFPFLGVIQSPQVMVSENGRAIAVQDDKGRLGLLYPRRNAFVTEIWAKAWNGGKFNEIQLPGDQCNKERCIVVLPSSLVLHIVYDPKLLQSSCHRADLLIAPRLWWVNCKERKPDLILNRFNFEQYGSHAIYISEKGKLSKDGPGIHVKTGLRDSNRPWVRTVRPKGEINDIAGVTLPTFPEPSPDPH